MRQDLHAMAVRLTLVRHGETAWTISRQHTGSTDLPLTARGEEQARALAPRLAPELASFALVLCSPLERARRTAALAGVLDVAEIDAGLLEWDYGDYEGLTTAEIKETRPDWDLFRDGCPGGESPEQVGARADGVCARLRAAGGDDGSVLTVGHGHFSRVLSARWLGWEPSYARFLKMEPSALSIIGSEHSWPAIETWNG